MTASEQLRPTLRELTVGIADVAAAHDRPVRGLSLDSRRVRTGDLFFATPGTRRHGRDFIDAAIAAGAVAVLVEDEAMPSASLRGTVPVIAVRGLGSRVGEIAARFFGDPCTRLKVIGVTGTNGKTTVSNVIAQALNRITATKPCGVIGTLGTGFPGALEVDGSTTPDPVTLQQQLAQMRDRSARSVAMEVSSHALDQSRVSGVRFSAAAFTNLTRDHLDYHGSMEGYGAAKRGLFLKPDLGAAVVNVDDPFGASLLEILPAGVPAYACTLGTVQSAGRATVLRGSAVSVSRTGIGMTVTSAGRERRLRAALLGRFNAANLLLAFATICALGVSWEEAGEALQGVIGVPGRMEAFQLDEHSPLVLVDYAHTPDGLRHVLQSARELCRGRLWCVFGCGGNRDPGKRPVMGAVAAELADSIIVTSDNPRDEDPAAIIAQIVEGVPAPVPVQTEADRARAVASAILGAHGEDVVVVAGKGHEEYQEIRGERLPMSDRALVLTALRERT
ncbi:MAG: UDP-N-acetylmuramoyl-L-alanyl-D-glutamate--2,6-diaminopimelate ligase [Gammaproteobacteria bacterium]|nr:UDP-N-acetylmuramoyl-L-alanyl-D-glutamate--2,6-diaminopimelate ligase [Gammaproteobacteria bacterium]